MALFEQQHFGKRISEKLSKYIRAYTGKNDFADVAERMGVSASTIRDVCHRYNTLTENSAPAIIEMMRIAIQNCNSRIKNAEVAKTELENILKNNTAI